MPVLTYAPATTVVVARNSQTSVRSSIPLLFVSPLTYVAKKSSPVLPGVPLSSTTPVSLLRDTAMSPVFFTVYVNVAVVPTTSSTQALSARSIEVGWNGSRALMALTIWIAGATPNAYARSSS